MTIRTKIRDFSYQLFPSSYKVWAKVNNLLGREVTPIYKPPFSGWGMTTNSFPPWHEGGDGIACDFHGTHHELVDRIRSGAMDLSQFRNEGIEKDIVKVVSGLMWRHYIVFWTSAFAARSAQDDQLNIVECGVADGLTAYFAMKSLMAQDKDKFKCFLYDSWEGMKEERLTDEEKHNTNRYNYLSVTNTQKNLIQFGDKVVFNEGFIPESFSLATNPEKIIWLHIDLNSSLPTYAALEYFFDRLQKNGVILFDDYAGYPDTKKSVDAFFKNKPGILLPLPTGQAVFFKS